MFAVSDEPVFELVRATTRRLKQFPNHGTVDAATVPLLRSMLAKMFRTIARENWLKVLRNGTEFAPSYS
jgi:hypothetical protein